VPLFLSLAATLLITQSVLLPESTGSTAVMPVAVAKTIYPDILAVVAIASHSPRPFTRMLLAGLSLMTPVNKHNICVKGMLTSVWQKKVSFS
jgi:hypothetical protein